MEKVDSITKMKPLIIAHAEDPDGIIARALKMRHYSMTAGNPDEHIFVRYDRIVEAFQEAATQADRYDTIFVGDVDLNPKLVQAGGSDFSLIEKLAKGRSMAWYDHHSGTLKHKEKLEQLGINVIHHDNYCAAMLIDVAHGLSERLLQRNQDDPYEKRLAKIAQAHDYKNNSSEHKNIKIGDELEKIISLANENLNYGLLLDLSCALRDEKCLDEDFNLLPSWQQYATEFDRRSGEAYQELDNAVEISTIEDNQVLFGYCSPLLSQKPGSFYLRKQYQDQADIFVCLFKSPVRNHIILTKEKSSFPVVPLLQSLGGGGRGNGGGFSLDFDIVPVNYTSVKEMLLSRIEQYSK